jgi:diadenosine tetraphosphatase ApaH/serine/threonine PP2A family protein phosphatase
VTFYDGNPIRYAVETTVDLGDRRAIVNVGSVGQPRDENPKAACGIYDAETGRVKVHRVAYDVQESARRILDAGLPPILAERLRVGR